MIEFKNIKMDFDDKTILDGFNLEIKEGDKILLSAPSGKGKTTLLKLLMGFEIIQQGDIIFKGKPLNEKTIDFIRSHISYVSQGVELQDKVVSVLIFDIFSYKHNRETQFNQDNFQDLIRYFELKDDILTKRISQLSGGEKQRLAFIIAILLNRDVWVFDEVTASLDTKLKEKIIKYIENCKKTVIAVSHDKVWEESSSFKIIRWGDQNGR